jgi:hypothetical protein
MTGKPRQRVRLINREGFETRKGTKMVHGSGNVFRDLGFREPEARNLALRSEVMIRIEEYVERSGMT